MKKCVIALLLLTAAFWVGCESHTSIPQPLRPLAELPQSIQAVMAKPNYSQATWSLLVVDSQTGQTIYNLNSTERLLIGSVRKLFSVGTALERLGPEHRFTTTVHRLGEVNAGILDGDLVLRASGDVTMGLRRLPDETMAITRIDHNEAAAVGSAELTDTDPRLAYRQLAQQIADLGVTEISGEVVVDDRLFEPFDFRGQFQVTPAFVNEDLVDVALQPTIPGSPAEVLEVRPESAAFTVTSTATTVAGSGAALLEPDPFLPDCIGVPGCGGTVSGELPVDGAPPFSEAYPIVTNFRMVDPTSFVRTVFIEELQKAGITVQADLVSPNPTNLLPAPEALTDANQLAQYTSLPFSQYARLILKVSFNLGADTTLMQFGLAHGVATLAEALEAERQTLTGDFGIGDEEFLFFEGAGGGESAATAEAVVDFLQTMASRPTAAIFRESLPVLGVDGTLSILTEYQADPSLVGASGNVLGKTGTFASGTPEGLIRIRCRAMAGYISTRSGREITYLLNVNNGGDFEQFTDSAVVNEDLATISAILWRDL